MGQEERGLPASVLVTLKRGGMLVTRWGCRLGDGQRHCRCSKQPKTIDELKVGL